MNKYYLSMYYGIDFNLPDSEFMKKINSINRLFILYNDKIIKRMNRGTRDGSTGKG